MYHMLLYCCILLCLLNSTLLFFMYPFIIFHQRVSVDTISTVSYLLMLCIYTFRLNQFNFRIVTMLMKPRFWLLGFQSKQNPRSPHILSSLVLYCVLYMDIIQQSFLFYNLNPEWTIKLQFDLRVLSLSQYNSIEIVVSCL